MSQENGGGIVLIIVSVILSAFVAWRIVTGTSYIADPAQKAFRQTDPFSIWLFLLVPGALAIVLGVGGIGVLMR